MICQPHYSWKIVLFSVITLISSSLLLNGCASSSGTTSDSVSSVSQERPALHQAALVSDVDKMKQLLAEGANPNEADNSDFTPLHWAAASQMGRNREMIKLLVEYGADPNLTLNNAKMVPLQFVSTAEGAQALIEAGARVDTRDVAQGTPLHNATKPDVARVLLDNGADPEARNVSGNTPAQHLRNALNYLGSDPIYNTTKQQYRDTIDVIENHQGGGQDFVWQFNTKTGKAEKVYTHGTGQSEPSSMTGSSSMAAEDPAERRAKELEADQACAMDTIDWFYIGDDCLNDYAQGNGVALNPYQSLKFDGLIVDGIMIEGVLYKDDEQIYEGKFQDGLAHGSGICFYQGTPEECRYYKGDRVDSLHKQREEFNRQQEMLSDRQQVAPAANYHHQSINGQSINNSGYQAPRVDTSLSEEEDDEDGLTDKIQDELIERGARRLLDEFF
jgi:outer membrane murein-binding lipoprotein Lpp